MPTANVLQQNKLLLPELGKYHAYNLNSYLVVTPMVCSVEDDPVTREVQHHFRVLEVPYCLTIPFPELVVTTMVRVHVDRARALDGRIQHL